jgi:hypothetical protein
VRVTFTATELDLGTDVVDKCRTGAGFRVSWLF